MRAFGSACGRPRTARCHASSRRKNETVVDSPGGPGSYLRIASERLRTAGFELQENVDFADHSFNLVATRKQALKAGPGQYLLVLSSFPDLDVVGMRDFSAAC